MAASAIAGQGMEMMTARVAAVRTPAQSLAERNQGLFETQRRARRGPTPEVFFAKHIDNTRIVKADDPVRRKEMRQFSAVMSVLFALVMVYVWQHFSAIEIGYHVEAQKQQVEQLREGNRQLRLQEAQLTDPGRIDVLAKQLGLDVPQPGQVVRPDGTLASPDAPVLGAGRTCSAAITATRLVCLFWRRAEVNEVTKQAPRQTMTAPIRRVRFAYVALFFCFWTVLIAGRLAWLQLVRHGDFVHRAAMQQQRTFEVAPRRGVLYDRNLKELAMTVLVDSVYAVPSELGENRPEAAEMLAKLVHRDPTDRFTSEPALLARFTASRNFAWVARRVSAETATRVRELNLKGVYLQKEFKRFYPNNDLAAQVLGYVGTDDTGLGGLEREFDDDMHGAPGHMLTALDAKRHVLGSDEQQPMPGENLVLTLDANIQYMAERALDAQMEKTRALHGTVVVQDPHTGHILALAVAPRFNPNDQKHMDASVLTNLAVSDIYEPGSTFKLVTYAAAIDGAGVQPTDMVDCQGGAMTMYGRTLHDDKSDHFGVVTVRYALEHSSDVGAAKMALKLGPQKFYDYIRGFGFGDRSGIELPSETRGLLRAPKKWGSTSILSLAIGQEVGVTPVQLVSMVSSIANGGVYMPPHVLLASADAMKGDPRLKPMPFRPVNQLPTTLPDGAHRVITELTSAKMRSIMQGIVTEGTGKNAQLNGYTSAGKTGTAQKVDPATHTYSHTKLVASFAGFAPVSNPAISVAVVMDTPQGSDAQRYGGAASAPVFAQVAQEVLEYLGVPHDQPLKTKKETAADKSKDLMEDGPSDNGADLQAMFAEVNELPTDDPLRNPALLNPIVDSGVGSAAATKPAKAAAGDDVLKLLPKKVLDAFHANGNTTSVMPDGRAGAIAKIEPPPVPPVTQAAARGGVTVDSSRRVPVPSFAGQGLRAVLEGAGAAGLRLQPLGSGMAREQAPSAGTLVPPGTEVVVRFTR